MEQAAVADKKSSQLELARLKNASEDYKVHKSNYIDPVTDEQLPGFKLWPEFRDEFLADWKSNRRIVTEKEADVIFDQIADESLTELETIGVTVDVNVVVDEVEKSEQDDTIGVIVANPETGEPIAVAVGTAPSRLNLDTELAARAATPKRRGRPAGKKVATAKVVRKVIAKKTSKPKKVAAKKKSGSTSEKAQAIIERYVARDWSRGQIIEKLQAQIDGLGAAYASTLYQKFA